LILALARPAEGAGFDLTWIPVNGGPSRTVRHFERPPNNIRISPNGRFVAYDALTASEGGSARQRDVFILSLENGQQFAMSPHPAGDEMLDWFPDGRGILFWSNRSGTGGWLAVRVVEGRTDSEPVLIRSDVSSGAGTFSRNGDFYSFIEKPSSSDILLATLDLETGRPIDGPAPLANRLAGAKEQGVWSPTGDRIAYVVPPLQVADRPPRQTYAIYTIATGETRALELPMQRIQNPVWQSDGRALVVQGTDLQRRQGLFRLDVDTGTVTSIVSADAGPGRARERPALSPDGERLYFMSQLSADDRARTVKVRDMATGTETVLSSDVTEVEDFALSADGAWIAIVRRRPSHADLEVAVLPTAGGALRRVATFKVGWTFGFPLAWSPDGRSIFVAVGGTKGPEIWRVGLDGRAQSTGLTWSGQVGRLSVHPDGARLLISVTTLASELWVSRDLAGIVRRKVGGREAAFVSNFRK
jgi:Tol biopolymer transport system component